RGDEIAQVVDTDLGRLVGAILRPHRLLELHLPQELGSPRLQPRGTGLSGSDRRLHPLQRLPSTCDLTRKSAHRLGGRPSEILYLSGTLDHLAQRHAPAVRRLDQSTYRRSPDAPARIVDDAPQRDLILWLHHDPKEGCRVRDLLPIEV